MKASLIDTVFIVVSFLVFFALPLAGIGAMIEDDERARDGGIWPYGPNPDAIDYDKINASDPPIVEPRGSVHGD